jgi:hypothetical protein
MSKTALVRIAVALAVALVAWGALALVHGPVSDRPASLALPRIDTARVDAILLAKGRDTTVLARTTARAAWTANGYRADSGAVASLLGGLADTARQSELVSEGRGMHAQLGVTPDSGTAVRVRAGGKTVLDLVTGKMTGDGSGVYVRMASADPVYALHGALASALHRDANEWRDTRIAAVVPDSVGAIEIRRKATYVLRRGPNGWQFASGAAVDTSAVSSLLGQYRDFRASGFAAARSSDSTAGHAAPIHVALQDRHGKAIFGLTMDSAASAVTARAESTLVLKKKKH